MAEYIDRDMVINKRRRMSEYDEAGWCVTCQAVSVEDIENTPYADVVEVVHGRWIKRQFADEPMTVGYRCSECHLTYDFDTNYCPNCGADMRGKKNE